MNAGSRWQESFDVVIAGTGAGGFSTAITAAEHGQRVLMLEKASTIGGTTRKSAAYFWILNNRFMRAAGVEDPRAEALQYLARIGHPTRYNPADDQLGLAEWEYAALEAFYDNGADAMEFLERVGALDSTQNPDYPDYHAQIAEDAAPYGRVLFPAAGEGGQVGGQILIDDFTAAAEKLGVQIRTSARVVDVVVEDGAVTGVIAESADGGQLRVQAERGVVFATGGFTHNADLRARFLRGPYVGGCAAVTNTGDFVSIASRLGAELVNMANAWSAPIVVERVMQDPEGVAGSFILPGESLIMVNRQGRRAVNEKMTYNEAALAGFAWDGVRMEYTNLPLIAIWDQADADTCGGTDFGNPIPPEGVDPYWVVKAETWEELESGIAERLQRVRPLVGQVELDPQFGANLRETVARYNGFAAKGVDEDFHRGATPHEQFHASMFAQMFGIGTDTGPDRTMRPLRDSGPYYATVMAPGTLDTKGGPRVNRDAQVVGVDGTPIPGLYGVGNCAGSPNGQGYWAAGGTIGPILTYGYLAGLAVSRASDRAVAAR